MSISYVCHTDDNPIQFNLVRFYFVTFNHTYTQLHVI
jgi:hypothetical protein